MRPRAALFHPGVSLFHRPRLLPSKWAGALLFYLGCGGHRRSLLQRARAARLDTQAQGTREAASAAIKIEAGYVGRFFVRVPWTALLQESVVVEIDNRDYHLWTWAH
eukprot:SAG11_NODE_11136_length_781_cov_1.692082_1_plen_107_part_00